MKKQQNEVWVGISDKTNDPEFLQTVQQEFVELPIIEALSDEKSLDLGSNRRDFLKYLGFGLGAATLAAGCEAPVRRAIPYVTKPDSIVPGVASYYASSFVAGGDYCPVLVKTREGRPIKIEGNALSSITHGGTSARAQAAVLSLYDTARIQGPGKVSEGNTEKITWTALDKAVGAKLSSNATVRIVANTIMSPSTKRAIADFKAKFPNTEVVQYDPVSSSAMLLANEKSFGQRVIPNYHFDKADVIVSFGADFLGTWISPTEYAHQYAKGRVIEDTHHAKMSRHIQVESGMSMTGSNADNRVLVKPSEQGAAIATLYNEIAGQVGSAKVTAPALNAKAVSALKSVAKELVAKRGHALVVAGSNNTSEQILINKINDMLGSYGATIDFGAVSYQRQGVDADIRNLVRELNAGSVQVLMVMGANPAFDLPNSDQFVSGMAKAGTKVSFNATMDETTALCDYVAPGHHFLESWGDVEAKRGLYSLVQPTISPLFNTRQTEETLLRWGKCETLNASAESPMYDYVRATWQNNIFPLQSGFAAFQSFWDNTLHDGVFEIPSDHAAPAFIGDAVAAAAGITKPSNAETEISFYESVNIGAGQYAGNPWLQEMPDPVTRCVWGNYLQVPVNWNGADFEAYKGVGKKNAKGITDAVEVSIGDVTQKLTAIPQFGQMAGTVAVALGFGRSKGSKSAIGVGNNVYPWLTTFDADGNTQYFAAASVSDIVSYKEQFASVQYHHTMGVTAEDGENGTINVDEKAIGLNGYQGSLTDRSVIFQSNIKDLEEFLHGDDNDPLVTGLIEKREHFNHLNDQTLYPFKEYTNEKYSQGHHWGMYVDLNACIGCGACTIACMAENNVPVVGKNEVHRHHEMAWLRIDRYYYGDVENPNVVYQPMMCQHCDNAPCENVCPVAATNHSSEGLNQMTYNRCIGTRYCANNCPYKVRRFNWLDYNSADLWAQNEVDLAENIEGGESHMYMTDNLTRMVLNPDVTVRARGVIEKCSFCVQRIQEGKLTAKSETRKLREGDVKTACQTSCPTGAITFGDTNNPKSAVRQKQKNQLAYRVLEEINVQSSVVYSAKINNRDESLDA